MQDSSASAVKREFRRRFLWRSGVAVATVIGLFAAYVETVPGQYVLAGPARGAVIGVLFLANLLMWALWVCPQCRKPLLGSLYPRLCPSCGVVLRDEPAAIPWKTRLVRVVPVLGVYVAVLVLLPRFLKRPAHANARTVLAVAHQVTQRHLGTDAEIQFSRHDIAQLAAHTSGAEDWNVSGEFRTRKRGTQGPWRVFQYGCTVVPEPRGRWRILAWHRGSLPGPQHLKM